MSASTARPAWLNEAGRRLRGAGRAGATAARLLALAVTPSAWGAAQRHALARQLVQGTAPLLAGYTALVALLSLVLIRIVVVTAQGYGLSQYAIEMVVRVLLLELIPLTAALAVALRVTLPAGAEIGALRASGALDALRRAGRDPLREELLPRVLGGLFAVVALATVNAVVCLVLAYLVVHGFTPWAFEAYTRRVGHVFSPAVSLVLVLKTAGFALAVALLPPVSALHEAPPGARAALPGLQGLVRTSVLILLIEILSLVGNYG